jgi:hypothetical protein
MTRTVCMRDGKLVHVQALFGYYGMNSLERFQLEH